MQLVWGQQRCPAMPPLSLWCPWEALGWCLQLPFPRNQRYLRYPASQAHRCAWTRGARAKRIFLFFQTVQPPSRRPYRPLLTCLDFLPI